MRIGAIAGGEVPNELCNRPFDVIDVARARVAWQAHGRFDERLDHLTLRVCQDFAPCRSSSPQLIRALCGTATGAHHLVGNQPGCRLDIGTRSVETANVPDAMPGSNTARLVWQKIK